MKITEILVRRGRVFEVRFDDGTYINLDRVYAEPLFLSVGMEVSEETAEKWEDESDLIRCRNRAVYYLSNGALSEKKLKEKLIKAGFEERFVIAAVERLKELSYVDDREFAIRFFEKCRASGLSARQSAEKMVNAGISRSLAKEVCVYSEEDERENIRRIINKSYKNKITDKEGIQKTTAALVRRGFAFSDVRAVLNQLSDSAYINEEQ